MENRDHLIQQPPAHEREFTLQEPVIVTIKRDLYQIWHKLKQVMIPSLREEGKKEMRNWDLWGPFALCLLLSLTLTLRTEKQAEIIFSTIFVIMWIGSIVVTLNARYLGSNVSFFQSACLLGYCVFPINITALITALFGSFLPALIKLILVALSFFWSTMSSISFLSELVPERKRKLALYPIFLFYLFLSWFALVV